VTAWGVVIARGLAIPARRGVCGRCCWRDPWARASWRGISWRSTREKVSALKKAYYEASREKVLACVKAYREANREKVSACAKAYREHLSDSYIADVLRMRLSEITADLLALKREQLQFRRVTKALINELNTRSQSCEK